MALCGSCECPVVQDAQCEAHGAVYLYITLSRCYLDSSSGSMIAKDKQLATSVSVFLQCCVLNLCGRHSLPCTPAAVMWTALGSCEVLSGDC